MRVIHVITRLVVGGAQENTITSVLGLQNKPGFSVELWSGPDAGAEGSMAPAFQKAGGHLEIIPQLIRSLHPWKDWRALQCLIRRFKTVRPDIVHTHSGKAGVLGRIAAARARVPVVIHTIHGPSFGPFQGPAANLLFTAAERHAAHFTDHFVSVADAMSAQYLAAGIGHPDQYSTIRSGFDLDPFLTSRNDPGLRKRLGIAPDDVVIGTIARLFKLKGHDDLINAAPDILRACPKARFLLVGDGTWRKRLESATAARGVGDRFLFIGLVPPHAVPQYVGIMDLLVHLSRREGLPRALPQAMAAGKPVVAFDCDGASEVCIEGRTGFLIPCGDRATLIKRVGELAADSSLRRQLGETGRILARDSFSADHMVDALHTLYLGLVEGEPGTG